jgi:hypothetical protein
MTVQRRHSFRGLPLKLVDEEATATYARKERREESAPKLLSKGENRDIELFNETFH